MKRISLLMMALLTLASGTGLASEETRAEIRNVVIRSYVEGVFVRQSPELVRRGFSPSFVMQVLEEGQVHTLTLDEWLDRLNLNGTLARTDVTSQVTLINYLGNAAVVRVEILENSELKVTDYFSLYHTEEGWQIVARIFHRHA